LEPVSGLNESDPFTGSIINRAAHFNEDVKKLLRYQKENAREVRRVLNGTRLLSFGSVRGRQKFPFVSERMDCSMEDDPLSRFMSVSKCSVHLFSSPPRLGNRREPTLEVVLQPGVSDPDQAFLPVDLLLPCQLMVKPVHEPRLKPETVAVRGKKVFLFMRLPQPGGSVV
jgi:hypothetical protein